MDNLFLLLAFASFFAFIVGLIKPSAFQKVFKNKATRKNLSIFFFGAIILFFILFSVTSEFIQQISETNPPTITTQKQIFDIPLLLDKNIPFFISTYGKAVNENPEPTDIAIQVGTKTWIKRFEQEGYAMAVTYSIENNIVTEIFLSKGTYDMPLEETWMTENEKDELLQVGNLSQNSSSYEINFLNSMKKDKFTGVLIKKK